MSKAGLGFAILASVTAALGPITATAAETQIQMLNKSSVGRFVYLPQLIRISPGDSVNFVAVDKGHNAVSIEGMLPQKAAAIEVPFNKNATLTLTEPGVYGVKCTPHVGLGMVALIVVGTPTDTSAIENASGKLPPKARDQVLALLAEM